MRNRLPHPLSHLRAAAWLVLAGLADPLAAQEAEPMIYTVGLVTEADDGGHWAYLHWRSTSFDIFSPQAWSVWRKDGLPGDPGNYTLDSVVRVQTGTGVIASLFERARLALGEDTDTTRETLRRVFVDLVPSDELTNAELASAVIQGAADHPEYLNTLQAVMRTYPSMAMALGTAHATPVPASGPVTFEIRHRATLTGPDEGVVGRVTVNAANPLVLPAPGAPVVAPFDPQRPATADLAIPLRWSTPAALRRLGLAMHGFNIYRVERSVAEDLEWHTAPPPPDTLAALADQTGTGIGRLNTAPYIPQRTLDATEAATADHTLVFIADHESRFHGFPDAHTPPVNGDQYFYFVTARDLLGRDGLVSPGVLGTFCSRLPPRVPVIVSVENEYSYDDEADLASHHLRVHWLRNPPEDDKATTAYALYRWESTEQLAETAYLDPSANLIAVIPQPPSGKTVSYLDSGPGSPSAPADYAVTFWYTVRAVDNVDEAAECAVAPFDGNVSGHSPPHAGVLRDRTGPGVVGGGLRMRCVQPFAVIDRLPDPPPDGDLHPAQVYVDYYVVREKIDPNLAWVELVWGYEGGPEESVRFEFPAGEMEFHHRIPFAASQSGAKLWVQARSATYDESVAASGQIFFSLPPPEPNPVIAFHVVVGVDYFTAMSDPRAGRYPCRAHNPVPPDIDEEDDGLGIITFLPPGTRQYKIFFRIEDSPLTLLHEDSGEFDPSTPITFLWLSLPVYANEVCFFVQAFDRHGNPGPLTPFGCIALNFKFGPPKPLLAPVLPAGTPEAPAARIQWFSPRWGISRFEILLRSVPPTPADLSDELIFVGTQSVFHEGGFKIFRRYLTRDLSAGFGNGASFTVDVPIDEDLVWLVLVRGITGSGSYTGMSNLEEFAWSPPDVYVGPDVPWPARPLPKSVAAAQFNNRIHAVSAPGGGGMVRIGDVIGGRIAYNPQTFQSIYLGGNPNDFVLTAASNWPGDPRRVLPMVLYRTQLPSIEWETVPGDVVQVSPLMETIAFSSSGGMVTIYDPFIVIRPPFGENDGTAANPGGMYLLDTQPTVSRTMYRYFLVLLNPVTGEIDSILVSNDVML
ncbi:MAG: hypothetical protein JJU00_04225 [Opitutales bacterium]|nr:hypothetical protein [Opitutales bacterium]